MTTGITVREALTIGGLKRGSLVAGRDGLDRLIRYVDVVEVPDVSAWVRRDEILVTTGYAIRGDDRALAQLVEILSQGGASGLVIKPQRFLGSLPDAMLEVANREKFPLITVPAEIPYIEITHPLLHAIFSRQTEHIQEIGRRITRLMIERSDIAAVASTLHEISNAPVLICDTSFSVIASAGIDPPIEQLPASPGLADLRTLPADGLKEIEMMIPSREGGEQVWIVLPVAAGSSRYGFLMCGKEMVQDQYNLVMAVMKNASALLALEFVLKEAVSEAENRAKREIVEALLHGSLPSGEFGEQAKRFGLDFGGNGVVLYGSFGRRPSQVSFQDVKSALERTGRASLVLQYGDRFLAILRTDAASAHEIGQDVHGLLKRELGRTLDRLAVGVSGFCRDIAALPRAYKEARQALEIGPVISGGPVYSFADVGLFEMMGSNLHEIVRYCRGVLEPLTSRVDPARAETLLSTLETYLDQNCNTSATARRLHLHRNTVRNHIAEIRTHLGEGFDKPPRNLTLRFALKILKIEG